MANPRYSEVSPKGEGKADDSWKIKGKKIDNKAKFNDTCNPNEDKYIRKLPKQKGAE